MTTCTNVREERWHPVKCDKPVKDAGLCTRHLAARRRKEAATAEALEREQANRARLDSAVAIGDELSRNRIASAPEYDTYVHGYTGLVVVDGAQVLAVLKARPGIT